MSTSATAHRGNHKASDVDLDTLRDDLASLRHHIAQISEVVARRGGDAISDVAHRGTEAISEVADQVKDVGKQSIERAETTIRTRPLLAVFLAFLFGMVFGRLAFPRR